jgi:hypothetical protein
MIAPPSILEYERNAIWSCSIFDTLGKELSASSPEPLSNCPSESNSVHKKSSTVEISLDSKTASSSMGLCYQRRKQKKIDAMSDKATSD